MARRELDFYETAPWQVDALVDYLPELSGTVLCPCVGDGSLMRRLRALRPDLNVFTSDIDLARQAHTYGDATQELHWLHMVKMFGGIDWVVENPPFNVEIDILKHAYKYAKIGVAVMARVSFTEPTTLPAKEGKRGSPRGPWLSDHPYDKRITLERYSFTGNGSTDSATTDWLVWSKVPLSKPFGVSAFGYRDGSAQRSRVHAVTA